MLRGRLIDIERQSGKKFCRNEELYTGKASDVPTFSAAENSG
jgi:hypothetical protein